MKEKFKRWLVKDHYIKVGLEAKVVLLVVTLIIIFCFVPMSYISQKEAEINQEIDLVCEQAWLYQCDKLELAYPFCYSAMNEFQNKNCTFNTNLSTMQRLMKVERYG